jgi:hypothetical protein
MPPRAERLTPQRATLEPGDAWSGLPTGQPIRATVEATARKGPGVTERRRRERHLRLLRRDLLIDSVAALVVMAVLLIETAGLGVIALLEIPVGAAVIGSFLAERWWRRRSRLDRRPQPRARPRD